MAERMYKAVAAARSENFFSYLNKTVFGATGYKGLAQRYFDKYVGHTAETNTMLPLAHYSAYAILLGYSLHHSHLYHEKKHAQEMEMYIPPMPTEADV